MNDELIKKLKEKKYITTVKVKSDYLEKEITQVGSLNIIADLGGGYIPLIPITHKSNAPLMDFMYKKGFAANKEYMTKDEILSIQNKDIVNDGYPFFYKFDNIYKFDEFQYFTNVSIVPVNFMHGNITLQSIKLPNTITKISSDAFEASSFKKIILPDSLKEIGAAAFARTPMENLILPKNLTSIGDSCFADMPNTPTYTIPKNVNSIGILIFDNHPNLQEIKVDPENTKYDSRDNCNAIIETSTNILKHGCVNTIIPESVTTLGWGSFYQLPNMTHFEIPAHVTAIDDYAFEACRNLTSLTCHAMVAPNITSITFGSGDGDYTGEYYRQEGISKLYIHRGATGYDTGYWASVLCNPDKCNFSIEYID